ncbi:MAG: hypothetical protein HOJ34_07780 [Kordiimonadaceae bacterium]|jgi:O2-independent ubiquinone biosynthesis accessory factor UbiT|nr:hypothetical protein [Kordiimonadaceae bacterium]MBT6329665.1 hypothetical protein [Kordiimonadaceae bacterium]MBT7581927.1 hypothetical protein [Kordiimonadaceae bacterium]
MARKIQGDRSNRMLLNDNFSPFLLAGMLTRNLPLKPIDIALKKITSALMERHPGVIERLMPIEGKSFLICPSDLPHKIRLNFAGKSIDCFIDKSDQPYDVKITGSISSLIAMIDGAEDGDALFFSRRISVEGDTEALLTLRNAIDSDDIDLGDEIGSLLGIFEKPAQILMKSGQGVLNRLNNDMEDIQRALITPLRLRIDKLEQENTGLRKQITDIEKKVRKVSAKIQSISQKR